MNFWRTLSRKKMKIKNPNYKRTAEIWNEVTSGARSMEKCARALWINNYKWKHLRDTRSLCGVKWPESPKSLLTFLTERERIFKWPKWGVMAKVLHTCNVWGILFCIPGPVHPTVRSKNFALCRGQLDIEIRKPKMFFQAIFRICWLIYCLHNVFAVCLLRVCVYVWDCVMGHTENQTKQNKTLHRGVRDREREGDREGETVLEHNTRMRHS